jgi:hypothetical protein
MVRKTRQANGIWFVHSEFAQQFDGPVVPQAGRGKRNAATPIQLWIRDWAKGREGMTGESIGVQVQGERGRCGVG